MACRLPSICPLPRLSRLVLCWPASYRPCHALGGGERSRTGGTGVTLSVFVDYSGGTGARNRVMGSLRGDEPKGYVIVLSRWRLGPVPTNT